ncbi:MAG: alcohol dehydrogenase catalytic domain-containing protein [Clostridia bacterium]|nr:alcohol dehydrogenase catalytic domain-containing protein [Clostridia bacterium]
MKAAVYHGPRDLRVESIDDPVLQPGDALLKVGFCGVCGTDVKTYLRGHHMFPPPCVLGHEVVGKIVEMKEPLSTTDIRVGDVVAVAPYVPCYSCTLCSHDRHELCRHKDWIDGAFAEYVRAPAGVLQKGTCKVPPGMDPRVACLSEPLACCVNAVTDSRVSLGDTVLIIGSGPMGLLMLELCKAVGASRVLVSEPNEWRRSEAEQRGAIVASPLDSDVPAWIRDHTDGEGADIVFICVGTADAVKVGMDSVRQGGLVNIFGGLPSGSELAIDSKRLHYDEVTLTGSFGFTPYHFRTALAMLASGGVHSSGLITHEYAINDARTALETAGSGEGLKILLKVDGDE